MSDNPDENDWREPPRQISHDARPEPKPIYGQAQDDPRSPVRKLLDLFALPDEREEAFSKAFLAAGELEATDPELAEQRREQAFEEYKGGGIPTVPTADGAPPKEGVPVTAGASGADVQLSMPKVLFPWWHVTPKVFPEEFDVPVRIRMADVVAASMPEPGSIPEDDGDEDEDLWVPDDDDETVFASLQRLWLKGRELVSRAEHASHIHDGVEERLSKIKTARALMPFIPEGKKAGELQKVSYTTVIAGGDSADVGWMFVEPPQSEYGKWFQDQLKRRYDKARAEWSALLVGDPNKKKAWWAACVAASAIVIANQEAAPSGINTYDSRVLSWGIGLAAPGLLQKVMYFLVQDPKIWKVFYCCGFMYGADIRAVKGQQDQYHGNYQIVDVERKAIVYGDNFYHRTIPRKQKKGEFQGKGFLALRAFVAQRELLHMLVQLARDPETRDIVLEHNYRFIAGAANVKGYEQLHSEALYVFIAQVQHNWGIAKWDPVGYAISTMDAVERALPRPSPAADRAIAKGVVRLVAKVLQEQRFQSAVKALRTGKYPGDLKSETPIWKFPAATEWGPKRLLDYYWTKLQRGERSQDNSKVEVPGFMVPANVAAPGNYLWREREPPLAFDMGPAARMDLRFVDDEVAVLENVDDMHVKIGRKDAKGEWQTEIVDATPRQ
jgi:hypothetical protein